MSKSTDYREANIEAALGLIMQGLAEPYEWQDIDSKATSFLTVIHTTWDEMAERGLIKSIGDDLYQLTGAGWIAGLKAVGRFYDQSFREKAGCLSRALKKKVKGRHEWGLTTRTELAGETGLSEFFIYDAIDSHLLRELFNYTDASWAKNDEIMKNYIDIPPRFGLELL